MRAIKNRPNKAVFYCNPSLRLGLRSHRSTDVSAILLLLQGLMQDLKMIELYMLKRRKLVGNDCKIWQQLKE